MLLNKEASDAWGTLSVIVKFDLNSRLRRSYSLSNEVTSFSSCYDSSIQLQ
jgi:hypothetical protein